MAVYSFIHSLIYHPSIIIHQRPAFPRQPSKCVKKQRKTPPPRVLDAKGPPNCDLSLPDILHSVRHRLTCGSPSSSRVHRCHQSLLSRLFPRRRGYREDDSQSSESTSCAGQLACQYRQARPVDIVGESAQIDG